MAWPFSKKTKAEPIAVYNQSDIDQMRQEIAANAQQAEGLRKRLTSAISGTYDNADTLHNVYLDYGYPLELEFANYWNMYRRLGIAKNVVELPVDTCWLSTPEIDGGAAFNSEFEKLVEKVKFWQRMKGLDNRQRVGRYAGMFMRVKDSKTPDKPIEGQLSGINSLVEIMPLYESQLKVLTTDTDPASETFGMPTMYQFQGTAEGNRNENQAASFSIHPSRLVIASEGADDGGIYGISSLEAPFNSLMDLRKIIGAGGEGFYKNASKDVVFTSDPQTSHNLSQDLIDQFNDSYDGWTRDRMRKSFMSLGLEAKTLDSNLVDPKEFFFNALYDVSAAVKIPATIIIGQQTGRLASDQDSSQYLVMQQSRRENFLTDLLENAFKWFITFGILPSAKVEIKWDDLLASSDDQKLEIADKMAGVNEKQFKSGQGTVFTPEKILQAAGFEEEKLPEFTEKLTDDAVDED